jgi:hypothetical protein
VRLKQCVEQKVSLPLNTRVGVVSCRLPPEGVHSCKAGQPAGLLGPSRGMASYVKRSGRCIVEVHVARVNETCVELWCVEL